MVAALVAMLAPAATARPRVEFSAVTTSARALAPGDTLVARVTLERSGRGRVASPKVGLVLAAGRRPRGGILLKGRPTAVRLGRRGGAAEVRGRVPSTVAAGRVLRVLACIDPRRAVARGGTCRAARRRVRITTTSAASTIDAAVAAGRLDRATATLYRLYLLAGDPRLPARYAGATADQSDHNPILQAAAAFPSLPAKIKRKVVPFFVPPAGRGSAWSPETRGGRAAARERPGSCQGFSQLDSQVAFRFENLTGQWKSVPGADGHSLVHYLDWSVAGPDPYGRDLAYAEGLAAERTARGRNAAQRFAAAMGKIWPKLTGQFGPPQSDANVACYNGGNGRFDVYVDTGGTINANNQAATALTLPYPGPGVWCTNRPAFTVIAPYEDTFTLAHEFMHALQFAHRYKSCAEPIGFWDEGVANWAGNFVYPDAQREHNATHGLLLRHPLGTSPASLTSGYEWWPLWMVLHRRHGTSALKAVFAAMASDRAIDAANKGMPGGWAEQLPKLLIQLWNQEPIGAQGFPINESFEVWDKWNGAPGVPQELRLELGGNAEVTLSLPSDPDAAASPLSFGTIQEVAIPDDNVRGIVFRNRGFQQGVHVDAALHMADGSWKLANWTNQQETTLCRDKDEEDVRELIVFSSSVSTTRASAPTHELVGRSECEPPRYKIDSIVYDDQLRLDGQASIDQCQNPSTDQTNTSTLGGPVADEPGGALSPPHSDGRRTGLMHALITINEAITYHGCRVAENGGNYVNCDAQAQGNEPSSIFVELLVPPGDAQAQITWRPRYSKLGQFYPPPGDPCSGFGGGAQVFPATTTTSVPRNVLFDPGTQTISIELSGSAPNEEGDGTVHSTARYGITFHRINEDGTAYTG